MENESEPVVALARAGASRNSNEFFFHKSLLSSISDVLDKHINNEMKEGRDGVLILSDVEVGTMRVFAEWAYTKDYGSSVHFSLT